MNVFHTKDSYRDLKRHIQVLDVQIKELNKQVAEEKEKTLEYWSQLEEQRKRTMMLIAQGNENACQFFYQDCKLANPMCLTDNPLNRGCKHRTSEIKRIECVVKGATNG